MSTNKIAVIGGDRRQAVIAAAFADDGRECAVYGLEGLDTGDATKSADLAGALNNAVAVVLPLPVSRDGKLINAPAAEDAPRIKDIETLCPPDALVLGGMIKPADFPTHRVRDYYAGEDLKLYNTLPTAEGALAIAMNELPTTVHGTKTLVMGFGRVGKALGFLLRGFGADIWIATRNSAERAVCEIMGFKTAEYEELAELLPKIGLVFNTVPKVILDRTLLEKIGDEVPVIDLATHPGGVDAAAAKELGKKLIWALSLPGKVAPVTAGEYIKKAIDNILKEEGKQ